MALRASSNSLPLSDLLQSTANARRTVRVVIEGRSGDGQIYIAHGEVVHAIYGDLVGNEAVYALLTDELEYQVEPDVTTRTRSVTATTHELILDAARLEDEGSMIRPTNAPSRLSDSSTGSSAVSVRESKLGSGTSMIAPVVEPARPPREASGFAEQLVGSAAPRRTKPLIWAVAGVSAIAAGLAVWFTLGDQLLAKSDPTPSADSASNNEAVAASQDEHVYEASELTGDDQPPRLISGPPVLAPRRSSLDPNVVVRVKIDAKGECVAQEIYRPRTELADFEAAALAAIESYRFEPAERDGEPVAAWFNVAVTFEQPDPRGRRAIRIKGSDTIGGDLGPALAAAYPDHQVLVTVEALGSSTGFEGLLDGTAEIGASSRPPKPDELAAAEASGLVLREFVIGYDGVAVIVHPDNPIVSLDMVELAGVFTGAVTNWKEVGGADQDIELYSRDASSGTHGFFLGKVLRADDAEAEFALHTHYVANSHDLSLAVAEHPAAIGYVGGAWAGDRVKVLAVDNPDTGKPVTPTLETISTGAYPIYRPLLLYTRKQIDRDTIGLLRFVLGGAGQAIVGEHGFVPAGVQPEDSLPSLDGAAEHAGVRVTRLEFESGVLELDEAQSAALEQLVTKIGATARVAIIGITETETERTSVARTQAVRQLLIAHGIGASRIQTRGSAIENHSSTAGGDRRRVDVYVIE